MGFLKSIGKIVGVAAPVVGAVTGQPWLAAAGSALGGLAATEDQQNFATNSAATANAFTKEQLQNRHQWEVNDLRAAGLNPILSAMKGAPSIGGSAQAVSNASIAENTAALDNAAANKQNSASAANQQRLNTQKLQAEIDLLKSNAAAQKASAGQSQTAAVKNLADTNLSKGQLENILATLPATKSTARNVKTEQDTWVNKYIRPRTKAIADTLGDFTGAIGNVFRGSQSSTTHYKGQ